MKVSSYPVSPSALLKPVLLGRPHSSVCRRPEIEFEPHHAWQEPVGAGGLFEGGGYRIRQTFFAN